MAQPEVYLPLHDDGAPAPNQSNGSGYAGTASSLDFETWQFRLNYLHHQLLVVVVIVAFTVEMVFSEDFATRVYDGFSITMLLALLSLRLAVHRLAQEERAQRICSVAYMCVIVVGSATGITLERTPTDYAQVVYSTALTGVVTAYASIFATSVGLPRWMFYVTVACDTSYSVDIVLRFEQPHRAQAATFLAMCQLLQVIIFELLDRSNHTHHALLENLRDANERREYEITILKHEQQRAGVEAVRVEERTGWQPIENSPDLEDLRKVVASNSELEDPKIFEPLGPPPLSPPPGPPSSTASAWSGPRAGLGGSGEAAADEAVGSPQLILETTPTHQVLLVRTGTIWSTPQPVGFSRRASKEAMGGVKGSCGSALPLAQPPYNSQRGTGHAANTMYPLRAVRVSARPLSSSDSSSDSSGPFGSCASSAGPLVAHEPPTVTSMQCPACGCVLYGKPIMT